MWFERCSLNKINFIEINNNIHNYKRALSDVHLCEAVKDKKVRTIIWSMITASLEIVNALYPTDINSYKVNSYPHIWKIFRISPILNFL